jgi:putative nucleotidyltransferase with HDIG domain
MFRGLRQRVAPRLETRGDPNLLITLVASAATAFLVVTGSGARTDAVGDPVGLLALVGLTLVLQLVSVDVYGRGSLSFASAGLLAVGFQFGAGTAGVVAASMGLVNFVARRGRLNRAVFDAADLCLAAGAAAALYHALPLGDGSLPFQLGASLASAGLYMLINVSLLCLAMSLAGDASPLALWRESFRWRTPYYLVTGPLAVALTMAYERTGMIGLLVFTLPPAMMMLSVRQYVSRTRASVEEVRAANDELRRRNEDLRDLFEFAGGLGATAHDRAALNEYVENSFARLVGARVRLTSDPQGGHISLIGAGTAVGALHLEATPAFDPYRWERLRDAILPQLATAVESADLVERVRKQHLATIAALSKSMEAKDLYTGTHTERVAEVSVALAKRLGYSGADLHAIEVGALLHDIGKIGIPERILQKAGPLDAEEWRVMKEHPIISEYILSEVDLPPIVLQIARHSHERMDGAGYPDGLVGEDIPLPARIVLVADAFDAITSDRPYRAQRHALAALEEVRAHTGTQFCPRVVRALERVHREEPHTLGATRMLRAVEVA